MSNEINQYIELKLPVKVEGMYIDHNNVNGACTILESSTYMRDFDTENNSVIGVSFDIIDC